MNFRRHRNDAVRQLLLSVPASATWASTWPADPWQQSAARHPRTCTWRRSHRSLLPRRIWDDVILRDVLQACPGSAFPIARAIPAGVRSILVKIEVLPLGRVLARARWSEPLSRTDRLSGQSAAAWLADRVDAVEAARKASAWAAKPLLYRTTHSRVETSGPSGGVARRPHPCSLPGRRNDRAR